MNATATAHEPSDEEWSLIRTSADRPDLDHYSNNPYDFLPAAKLNDLIGFLQGDNEASSRLTIAEREALGKPSVRKILVKVVGVGTTPIDEERSRLDTVSSPISNCPERGGYSDIHQTAVGDQPCKAGILLDHNSDVARGLQGDS